MKTLIIAVDGPAAAGKGTLAAALARSLGLPHLDTGLLYRAVARQMLLRGMDPQVDAGEAVALALQPADLARDDLRVSEIDRAASAVATQPGVRAALLQRQRDFAAVTGAVIDGRDIGTVVFPNATVKLFVTASARTRALRRHLQLHDGQVPDEATLGQLVEEIAARDTKDANRELSPLKCSDDAVIVETDDLDSSQVLDRALKIIQSRHPVG